MAEKTPYKPTNLPDMSQLFSWGLRVSKFDELFFISGLADMTGDNSGPKYPGDPVGQTRSVLERMAQFIDEGGFALDDVVRLECTFRSDVKEEHYPAIFALWEEFFAPMKVKPAGGTLRVVERLVAPEIMVEYELLLAR